MGRIAKATTAIRNVAQKAAPHHHTAHYAQIAHYAHHDKSPGPTIRTREIHHRFQLDDDKNLARANHPLGRDRHRPAPAVPRQRQGAGRRQILRMLPLPGLPRIRPMARLRHRQGDPQRQLRGSRTDKAPSSKKMVQPKILRLRDEPTRFHGRQHRSGIRRHRRQSAGRQIPEVSSLKNQNYHFVIIGRIFLNCNQE